MPTACGVVRCSETWTELISFYPRDARKYTGSGCMPSTTVVVCLAQFLEENVYYDCLGCSYVNVLFDSGAVPSLFFSCCILDASYKEHLRSIRSFRFGSRVTVAHLFVLHIVRKWWTTACTHCCCLPGTSSYQQRQSLSLIIKTQFLHEHLYTGHKLILGLATINATINM